MQRGNLKPAHTGYRYQDIATAYYLIGALIGRCDSVTVDKKQVEDDRLDDLEISISGYIYRKQIKSSPDASRSIKRLDFTGARSTLRIDRLVLTHIRSIVVAKEYRLCATWQPPESGDDLFNLLDVVASEPTFDGTNVSFYKFKADQIWPIGGKPIWSVLENYMQPDAEFVRDDFIEFCNKFIIELQLPTASKDLLNPGPLESSVLYLLREYVGIGRYPNAGRQCEDVAALAVSLANLARTKEATLLPDEISRNLEIRMDFGRVSQAFPVDKAYFYDRPDFRGLVRTDLQSSGIYIVTAPPGAGKSWELTCLAEELADDFVVARHYCYLEPGDELIERRVTTDVFFANILSELYDAEPKISSGSLRLSADLKTLEEALARGVELGKKIVLIIDGLDHIARVQSASNRLSDDETDIIERLSTLTIPEGVSLVLGSQPGNHLDPLFNRREKDVHSFELPSWNHNDVIELTRLHGVDQALISAGLNDSDELVLILNTLAERSAGNPLYVRYLCRGIITGLETGIVSNPVDWLLDSPDIGGDVAIYYKHLYENILSQAQAIADLFGVLDFSVSELELKEILPGIVSSWLPEALIALSPILIRVTGQGGVRIFHESFRRFMLDELNRQERSLSDVLSPVIDWLEHRDFFQDAKSYRFLLPAFRKAGRDIDIINRVDFSFVSESVSNGHPVEAIQRNLSITAEVAGRARNWPVLVRCAELRRALSTCFDIGSNDWNGFWVSYADIFGVEALAERLLFDGKPTLSYEEGLQACLLVDDLGGVAPWQEYLAVTPNTNESGYSGDFDHTIHLTEDESLNLAAIQGRLRLGNGWRILYRLYKYLTKVVGEPKVFFIRKISMRFSRMGNISIMEKLATKFDEESVAIIGFAIRLGIADELSRAGDEEAAHVMAEKALHGASSPSLVIMCMEFGVIPASPASHAAIPVSIDIGVGSDNSWPEAANIRIWLSSIRLLAHTADGDITIDSELNRVQGEGWYYCWLRYALALSKAEAASKAGTPLDINAVFTILAEDVRPFAGNPRACDLYRLHGVIAETLSLGLSLIKTRDEWDHAIEVILKVSRETASRLDREDGGPVSMGTVIDILSPHALSTIAGKKIYSVIEEQVKASDRMGTYYSTHAEYNMSLAVVQMNIGLDEKAEESWKAAGIYLAGYGYRKDITLFDIIESVPVLLESSKDSALKALENLQPLIAAVLRHTDGRETKHTPNTWFENLLFVDSSSAIDVLARTVLEEDCIESWPTIRALQSVAKYSSGKANPILVDALWETIPFEVEYENNGKKEAKLRLEPLDLLYKTNSSLALERLHRLSAQAANDATKYNYDSVVLIEQFALDHGSDIQCNISKPVKDKTTNNHESLSARSPAFLFDVKALPFPPYPSLVDVMSGIRAVSSKSNEPEELRSISLYLAYKLDEMLGNDDEVGARRILHFFAREISAPLSSQVHPLSDVALYLENAGCDSLATIAYALAYTQSRGGGGWYEFGGDKHSDALHRAIALDRNLAQQTVADEVSYRLRNTEYGAGISKGLINRIVEWGDSDVAAASWKEAFDVISHRLPLSLPSSWFATFSVNELSSWNINEGIVSLLLVRLSEPRITRKISALSGLLKAFMYCPDAVARPLAWWLCRDTPTTSLLLVFQLLLLVEDDPYQITVNLQELLTSYSRSDCWGVALITSVLLERAGIVVPQKNNKLDELSNYAKASSENIEVVFRYDTGDTLKILSRIDPELPDKVSGNFLPLLENEMQVERIKERLKLSFGRDHKGYPPTDVLFWQFELFIAVLHEQACGLKDKLWKKGIWSKDKEISLFMQVQPEIALHLAIFNSRIPRPAWKEPCELLSGESNLIKVTENSKYKGWLQLGLVEEQYINGEHGFSRPTEYIRVFSGASVAPIGTTCSAKYFPFIDGDYSDWWGDDEFQIYQRPHDRWTQLLSLTRNTDWLGSDLVLIPPKEIIAISDIKIPGFGDKLVWNDSDGNPILVCRFWRVRGNQFDIESDRLCGSDLIIRPDLVEKLEVFFSSPIKMYTKVSREDISE